MLSKLIVISIIVIIALIASVGFFVYTLSKSPPTTEHTLAYLLNEDNFEKFNELQKDRYNELRNANTDLSEKEIQKKSDEYWDCLMGNTPVSSDCISYDKAYAIGGINKLTDISGYKIVCDINCNLSLHMHYNVDKKLEIFQNENLHKKLFASYLSITPKIILDELVYLYMTTDDYGGNEAAATMRNAVHPLKFSLSIDPVDMAPSASIVDEQFHKSLMIHENAHILSLGSLQTDNDILYYDTDKELREMMMKKQPSCAPNYFSYAAGCMREESYLNLFFQKFWTDVYSDFKHSFEFDDHDEFLDHNVKFYTNHQNRFLSEYAALNPEEDFADSFTAFVLKEKPTKSTIADQKILFFYDFPEMVMIRDFIRSNI